MSVGHVARLLEEAGIATVVIGTRAWRDRMLALSLARVVVTPHLAGRPIGAPGDRHGQRQVLMTALNLLEQAQGVGAVIDYAQPYAPGRLNGHNGHHQ